MKAEIATWWEDEAAEEENWQDVSKKGGPRSGRGPTVTNGAHSERRGGRGISASRGNPSDRGSSRGGGRATSSARGGAPSDRRSDKAERASILDQHERKQVPKDEANAPPVPVKSAPSSSHVAWGKVTNTAAVASKPILNVPELEIAVTPVMSAVTRSEPPPTILESNMTGPTSKLTTSVAQNVWLTKGAAPLIEAEKVKPVTVPQKQHHRSRNSAKADVPEIDQDGRVSIEKTLKEPLLNTPLIVPSSAETEAIQNGLSASVNGANVNAAGWKPPNSVSLIDPVQASVSIPPPNVSLRIEPSVVSDRVAPVAIKSFNKPKTSLNMGKWAEAAAGEEVEDYSFGSFGVDNDVSVTDGEKISAASILASGLQAPPQEPSKPLPNVAASIATSRPPPGLAIPIPANVVHVHELENKLESASLVTKKDDSPEKTLEIHEKKTVTSQQSIPHLNIPMNQMPDGFNPSFPQGAMSQTFLGAYGMSGMGMYNYNPSNYMAVPPNTSAPVLPGGPVPQQQKQQLGSVQPILTNVASVPQLSAGVYPSSSPSNPPGDSSRGNDSSSAAGLAVPPGMHGAMPFNPALYYAGQQPFQMGQPHGAGYGYGYGHVQGGFGYQHMMGQGGYGQHYDEQQQHVGNMNAHHTGTTHQSGYNKNAGGYRGRNPHHTNQYSQYQGQYGYGGQPYNIPYAEHFNQLGGYGPGGMDPYMQNNGYPASGINGFSNQDDEQQSGNKVKGNNRKFSNPNINQYQQGPSSFADGSGNNASSSYQGGWNNSGL